MCLFEIVRADLSGLQTFRWRPCQTRSLRRLTLTADSWTDTTLIWVDQGLSSEFAVFGYFLWEVGLPEVGTSKSVSGVRIYQGRGIGRKSLDNFVQRRILSIRAVNNCSIHQLDATLGFGLGSLGCDSKPRVRARSRLNRLYKLKLLRKKYNNTILAHEFESVHGVSDSEWCDDNDHYKGEKCYPTERCHTNNGDRGENSRLQ